MPRVWGSTLNGLWREVGLLEVISRNEENAFRPVSATRARGIVAGRAKGRIAFEGSEHGADSLSLTVFRAKT